MLAVSDKPLSYGGTLVVTVAGSGMLEAGDTFTLFHAPGFSGAFASIRLPALPQGLTWDTGGLTTNGTIVVSAARHYGR